MILAIDQGTTGTHVLLVDETGAVRRKAYREITQHFPRPGWVEHDPEATWQTVLDCTAEILGAEPNPGLSVAGIGITNQRETFVLWDRATLRPVAPAIVWQCRRSVDICHSLKEDGREALFRERTGLLLDPYFSGTKLRWLLESDPEIRRRADEGALAFGTIDTWLVARLSGGREHLTEPSNASRTLLFNILRHGRAGPAPGRPLRYPGGEIGSAETTAVGAAFLAGLATGVWGGLDQVASSWRESARFEPNMAEADRERRLAAWHEAVGRALYKNL